MNLNFSQLVMMTLAMVYSSPQQGQVLHFACPREVLLLLWLLRGCFTLIISNNTWQYMAADIVVLMQSCLIVGMERPSAPQRSLQ